jgi:hypothetical protein
MAAVTCTSTPPPAEYDDACTEPRVIISEVAASGADGEPCHDDWVELFNPHPTRSAPLLGLVLSDDHGFDRSDRLALGASGCPTSLANRSYLLLCRADSPCGFAFGIGRHDVVLLFNASGSPLDETAGCCANSAQRSFGRSPGGAWTELDVRTPGAPNTGVAHAPPPAPPTAPLAGSALGLGDLRHVATLVVPPPRPGAAAVVDLSGVAVAAWEDLSSGGWRATLQTVVNSEPAVIEVEVEATSAASPPVLRRRRTFLLEGFEDTEGIALLPSGQVAIAQERRMAVSVLLLPPASSSEGDTASHLETRLGLGAANTFDTRLPAERNKGLEGVAYDPEQGLLYAVQESDQ